MSKYSRNLPEITILSMPLADTEYSYSIPEHVSQILFKLRAQNVVLKVAYVEGGISAGNYITIPAGSSKTIEHMNMMGKTLYVSSASTDQSLEIEVVKQ